MKLGYEKIASSNFEPGHTSQWLAKFDAKNGADKLNMIGGYAPIQDYSFSETILSTEIQVSPFFKSVKLPTFYQQPTSISLTFYEDHTYLAFTFFSKYMKNLLRTGRTPSLQDMAKHAFDLIIRYYKKNDELLFTYYLSIFPIDDIVLRGDQTMSLNNFPMEFAIVGMSKK